MLSGLAPNSGVHRNLVGPPPFSMGFLPPQCCYCLLLFLLLTMTTTCLLCQTESTWTSQLGQWLLFLLFNNVTIFLFINTSGRWWVYKQVTTVRNSKFKGLWMVWLLGEGLGLAGAQPYRYLGWRHLQQHIWNKQCIGVKKASEAGPSESPSQVFSFEKQSRLTEWPCRRKPSYHKFISVGAPLPHTRDP